MRQPPQYLSDLLTRIGGLNFFGEPNFRLVRAEERLRPSGGVWLDWPKEATIAERNQRFHRPWRRTLEVRMVKRYGPIKGWVLEQWTPPHLYGSPKQWYSTIPCGGTLLFEHEGGNYKYVPTLGDYPFRGEYEYTGYMFPTDTYLSEATVIPIVQRFKRNLQDLPRSPKLRIAYWTRIAYEAAQAADKKFYEEALNIMSEASPAFGLNPFSGYGTKRTASVNRVARKLGIKSHTGVS